MSGPGRPAIDSHWLALWEGVLASIYNQ